MGDSKRTEVGGWKICSSPPGSDNRALSFSRVILSYPLLPALIHVLPFPTGTLPLVPEVVPEEVYANLSRAFQVWYVAVFYVIAAGVLGFHLYHGAWSMFQTLGLDNPDRNRSLRWAAALGAVILVVGFCSVPLLFIIGVMPEAVP